MIFEAPLKHFHRYLPLSEEVRSSGLYVISGGYALIPPHTPYPPLPHPSDHDFSWKEGRTLSEYALVYLTRGNGTFESKTMGPCRVRAGDAFILFPGEWHRYGPDPATGWDEYWVSFGGDEAESLVAASPFSLTEALLSIHINPLLIEEFVRLTEEMRDDAVGARAIIAARARLIVALSGAAFRRQTFEGSDILPVIEKAKRRLADQIAEPVNMEKMASELGVGYSWFRRMFRQYTGLSPAQYHLQLRINHACELLSKTTLPVAKISERTGFPSVVYFSSLFHQKIGYSPSDYRAMAQKNH